MFGGGWYYIYIYVCVYLLHYCKLFQRNKLLRITLAMSFKQLSAFNVRVKSNNEKKKTTREYRQWRYTIPGGYDTVALPPISLFSVFFHLSRHEFLKIARKFSPNWNNGLNETKMIKNMSVAMCFELHRINQMILPFLRSFYFITKQNESHALLNST